MLNTSFRNTNRHFIVNIVYFITGITYVFLHISFVVSCLFDFTLGFSLDWLNGSEFWNSAVTIDDSCYGMFGVIVGMFGFYGLLLSLYVGYMALCHLFTALGKVFKFACHQIITAFEWMDGIKIA